MTDPRTTRAVTSEELRSSYTREYYLQDCGGWDSFEINQGRALEDPRLRAVFALALPLKEERVLDLGCGRGELSCQAARNGAHVTGVDYSAPAIQLARACLENEPALALRVTFACADLKDFTLRGPYEKVFASDLVEHLAADEVESLYGKVSRNLSSAGLFVVHTYPNRWYYQYGHAAKVRRARRIGCFLPDDPRPPYERLMHINEQSPPVMRRQLRRHFPHVALWFASPEDVAGNLVRRFGKNELRDARDLFAVASHAPIDLARLRARLVQPRLSESDRRQIRLEVREAPTHVRAGERFVLHAAVANLTREPISSGGEHGLNLAYHWTSEEGAAVVYDGWRSPLLVPVPAGATAEVTMRVEAPGSPGRYRLQPRVVQEHVAWLENDENAKPRFLVVDVA